MSHTGAVMVYRRAWRIIRRSPRRAVKSWLDILANESQLFSLALATLTSWIGLQTATIPELFAEASGWINAIVAFAYVAAGWAVICAVRAPFLVVADDAKKGRWVRPNVFNYYEPMIVVIERFKAAPHQMNHEFHWPDVEPGSFVQFSVSLDPDVSARAKFGLLGVMTMGPISMKQWPGTGSMLLPRDNRAVVMLELEPETRATTLRLYCHGFTIGEADDHDGGTGNAASPFRLPPWWKRWVTR